jgi:hypothetical protein
MFIEIHISAEVQKIQGAFRSKDACAEAILEEISEPGTLYVEDSEYEVISWEVTTQ